MAISLGKTLRSTSVTPSPINPVAALRFQLSNKFFDGYCDDATLNSLFSNPVITVFYTVSRAEANKISTSKRSDL